LRDEPKSNPSSDADRRARRTDQELFSDSDDGYNSQNQGLPIDEDPGLYDSAGDYKIPSNFDESGYESPNQYAAENTDEFQQSRTDQRRRSLIDQAKRLNKRGRALIQNRATGKVGEAIGGDKQTFRNDTEKNREEAKRLAARKARRMARDQLTKRIGNEGINKGIKKGLSKETGKLVKEGAKRAGKRVVQGAAKGAAETGAKVAGQAAGKAAGTAAAGALEGAVTAGAAATGVETFGIGFVVGLLLNIAISLGVSDAVDATFELAHGDFKHARFLAIRAAAKVGMFFVFLVSFVMIFSIGGLIVGIPILVLLNVYMILGMLFKNFAPFQGFVWWEKGIIIFTDIMAFMFTLVFILTMGWYLCTATGLGGGGVRGAVSGAIVSVYDWWNKSTVGGVAADFCKFVNTGAATSSTSTTSTTSTNTANTNTTVTNTNTTATNTNTGH
ncbi:MAG TPA: hypothetical protein VHQ20_02255, partial [Patescibacteria group bacterium]|nr:hypothetical protein [Patescibacteria group bacterium]